jgi:hypothetical protein
MANSAFHDVGRSENETNRAIYDQLKSFQTSFGPVDIGGRLYDFFVHGEGEILHQKRCSVDLRTRRIQFQREICDIVLLVDHTITDRLGSKLVYGAASFIQTKKESYISRQGYDLEQLYLMTYWPKFRYRNESWLLKALPDCFSFYLLLYDQSYGQWTPAGGRAALVSAPMLARTLELDEMTHLEGLQGRRIPVNNRRLIYPFSRANQLTVPILFESFMLGSILGEIGSQSAEIRRFLRDNFFPNILSAHDCGKEKGDPELERPENEGDIFGIRIEVGLKELR